MSFATVTMRQIGKTCLAAASLFFWGASAQAQRPAPTKPTPHPARVAPAGKPVPAPLTTYTNPVIDRSLPDPGVLLDNGVFYMTHTTGGPDQGWPLYRSPDLVHWEFLTHLLTTANKPHWMRDSFWAPEIHKVEGVRPDRYLLTFTSQNTDTGRLCVGLAFAPSVQGPYTVQDKPLVDTNVSVLDSHVFQDSDGKRFFVWKRDADAPQPGGNQGVAGAIYGQELTSDASAFTPGSAPVKLLEGDPKTTDVAAAWERGLVEAPWIVRHGGYYYLFYSGAFIDTSYALGVARATSPLGPYTRCPGNPILRSNSQWGGPGHGAVIQDAAGDWWHLYHARHQDNPKAGRVQMLDRVYWLGDWPAFGTGGTPSFEPQAAPRTTPAPRPPLPRGPKEKQ